MPSQLILIKDFVKLFLKDSEWILRALNCQRQYLKTKTQLKSNKHIE